MGEVWEVIKGFGALVGLATGLFVVWDRFFRHTPTAVLFSRPLIPGSQVVGVYLRVSNPSDRPILFSWENGSTNGRFGIAKSHDLKDVVLSLIEGRTTIVVDSGQFRDLLVLSPPDRHQIDPDNHVEADFYWSFVQPKLWKRDRRISVRIPMRSLRALDPHEYDDRLDDEER